MPTFPTGPTLNQAFNTTSGRFIWNGYTWAYQHPLGATGPTGPTGSTGSTGSVPTTPAYPGMVQAYVGTSLPSGWLWCDGTSVTSASYPALFNILTNSGTIFPYGGSGTTTSTPDLRSKLARGRSGNTITTNTVGANTGAGGTHTHTTVYNANTGNTSDAGTGHAAAGAYFDYTHGHYYSSGGPSANSSSRDGNAATYVLLPSSDHGHAGSSSHGTTGGGNAVGNHAHSNNAPGITNAIHGDESTHTHAVSEPGSVTVGYIIKT